MKKREIKPKKAEDVSFWHSKPYSTTKTTKEVIPIFIYKQNQFTYHQRYNIFLLLLFDIVFIRYKKKYVRSF